MQKYRLNAYDIFNSDDARLDFLFCKNHLIKDKDLLSFNDVFEICSSESVDTDDLDDEFLYCQIGDIDKDGHAIPIKLSLKDIDDEENEFRNYYNKIFKYKDGKMITDDIMYVSENDILIAKTRPNLNKVLFIENNKYINYSNFFYTTAFIRIRVKLENVTPTLGYYLIKNVLNTALVSVARIGKSGYPSIQENDLKYIKIPMTKEMLQDEKLNNSIKELHNKKIETEHKAKIEISKLSANIQNLLK